MPILGKKKKALAFTSMLSHSLAGIVKIVTVLVNTSMMLVSDNHVSQSATISATTTTLESNP